MKPTTTEAAICCMIVSNPCGGMRPHGWQKRVNDLIRAQDQELATLRASEAAALERVKRLETALTEITDALKDEPEYHEQGMGCGLEDRNITDRYEAMSYGWSAAMDRVYDEQINYAIETATAALTPTADKE